MSLLDQLHDDDDFVRLWAARRAAEQGDAALVGTLLDLVLHDDTEVQVAGGMAEADLHVGAAAAASKAVLSPHRTGELTRRFLADPSPLVRVEAIEGAQGVTLADLERMLTDPVPRVRCAAVKHLRYATTSEAFVAAARVETDLSVREAFLPGLVHRRRTPAARTALVGHLADGGYVQRTVADALAGVDDPGVAAAIASRILVHPDERWAAGIGGLRAPAHPYARAAPAAGAPAPAHALRRAAPDAGHGAAAVGGRAGALSRVRAAGAGEGPVEGVYHDDDRTAESEDGYAVEPAGGPHE